MTLRIVGAGLGRTGTSSLRQALETLLGAPSYHMTALMSRPGDVAKWRRLVEQGAEVDWRVMFDGFGATQDWPACAYWESIAAAFPDAFVLLSTRESLDAWYASFARTIAPVLLDTRRYRHPAVQLSRLVTFATFTDRVDDEAAVKRAYEQHNARVRASVPADRLIDWQPHDGWGPICAALRLPLPAEKFPHVNSGDEFREILGLAAKDEPRTPRRSAVARFRRLRDR